jgi:leucyl/phenylalanyl-tRNA---protein transferase
VRRGFNELPIVDLGNRTIPHPLSSRTDELYLGDLDDIESLILAYRYGVFPWFEIGRQAVFYAPFFRYVILPEEIKIPKSINSYFNQTKFSITLDTAFDEVITNCQNIPRHGRIETWISDRFVKSYKKLHTMGYAHSVEVWDRDHNLVGGLYGVALGNVFHGESMFSKASNASRFALISLSKMLADKGFSTIDCQMINPFLETFGGVEVDKYVFHKLMQLNLFEPDHQGSWTDWTVNHQQ